LYSSLNKRVVFLFRIVHADVNILPLLHKLQEISIFITSQCILITSKAVSYESHRY
jgi:hypothetical protein